MGTTTANSWYKNASVYHIYLRSFKDSNNDGVGDIPGITEKLDYLQHLGIDVIWISPFYKSPMADFGYDVSDYCDIEPIFGTLADFDVLIQEAHRRNIKVLIDFVPNHTSDQHPWFVESQSSKNNPKRDWYIWQDPKPDGSPPNNWISVFGGSAWEYDKKTNQYYLHTFLPQQPDLNWRNKEVRHSMYKILQFWLDRGVDGFRMDAVYFLIKDGKFRDEPINPNYGKIQPADPYDQLLHIYTAGLPSTMKIISLFSKILESYGERFMVTELVQMNPRKLRKWYKATDNGIHAPFNFNFIFLPWTAKAFKKFVDEFERAVSTNYVPTHVLGNHDVSRVATRLGPERARVAAMLLLSLRGMPYIYNGDEVGMIDAEIPSHLVQDPFEKRVPGMGKGRDPQRTPLQWDTQKNAGFSALEPWLPVNTNYKQVNVENELRNQHSMLNLYRTLLQLRKSSNAIIDGLYKPIRCGNSSVFAFVRESGKEKILVLLNFSDRLQPIYLPFEKGTIICDTYLQLPPNIELPLKNWRMAGNAGYIFRL